MGARPWPDEGGNQRGSSPPSARDAYNAWAPGYDEYTARNDHEAWLGGALLPELDERGLRVGCVLDVGCGTGRAFAPLISRGWKVFGCDVSEGMLARAEEKYPGVPLRRADATDLPAWDLDFDLILLLGDVVNYLAGDGDLERCFDGVARNLAPDGLCLFDTNTIGQMREIFGTPQSQWMSIGSWKWRSTGTAVVAGGTFEAELSGAGVEPRIHRQRHWTRKQVREAEAEAGLECLALLGQSEDGSGILLSDDPDEERDVKLIHIVRRARQRSSRGGGRR